MYWTWRVMDRSRSSTKTILAAVSLLFTSPLAASAAAFFSWTVPSPGPASGDLWQHSVKIVKSWHRTAANSSPRLSWSWLYIYFRLAIWISDSKDFLLSLESWKLLFFEKILSDSCCNWDQCFDLKGKLFSCSVNNECLGLHCAFIFLTKTPTLERSRCNYFALFTLMCMTTDVTMGKSA